MCLGGSDTTQFTVGSSGHTVTIFGIWRNNHRLDSGAHGSHCETDLRRNSIDHPISTSPFSGGHSGVWGSQNQYQFRASIQQSLKSLILLFFPVHSYPDSRLLVPLGKTGRKITVYLFDSVLGSFLKGTQPLLHSWGSGSVNCSRLGINRGAVTLYFYDFS